MNEKYKKSTLAAYSENTQTLQEGEAVVFNDSYITGCSIRFINGGTSAEIVNAGLYLVSFNGYTEERGQSLSQLRLLRDDEEVAGAMVREDSRDASVSFTTVIEVLPNQCPYKPLKSELKVINQQEEVTYGLVNLTIIKIA